MSVKSHISTSTGADRYKIPICIKTLISFLLYIPALKTWNKNLIYTSILSTTAWKMKFKSKFVDAKFFFSKYIHLFTFSKTLHSFKSNSSLKDVYILKAEQQRKMETQKEEDLPFPGSLSKRLQRADPDRTKLEAKNSIQVTARYFGYSPLLSQVD